MEREKGGGAHTAPPMGQGTINLFIFTAYYHERFATEIFSMQPFSHPPRSPRRSTKQSSHLAPTVPAVKTQTLARLVHNAMSLRRQVPHTQHCTRCLAAS